MHLSDAETGESPLFEKKCALQKNGTTQTVAKFQLRTNDALLQLKIAGKNLKMSFACKIIPKTICSCCFWIQIWICYCRAGVLFLRTLCCLVDSRSVV